MHGTSARDSSECDVVAPLFAADLFKRRHAHFLDTLNGLFPACHSLATYAGAPWAFSFSWPLEPIHSAASNATGGSRTAVAQCGPSFNCRGARCVCGKLFITLKLE
jgi:hypothetical protein